MRDFNRNNRSGGWRGNKRFGSGGRNSGGGRSFDRDSGRPTMHSATCAQCGKECEVPFRPSGDKPVYCSECFETRGNRGDGRFENSGGRDGGRFPRRDFQKSRFDDKQMFNAVCDKCGKECEVPFRPTSGKPVFCEQCFEKGGVSPDKGVEKFTEQFEILNTKLDQILDYMKPVITVRATREEVTEAKSIKPKIAVKKQQKKTVIAKVATKNKAVVKKASKKNKK